VIQLPVVSTLATQKLESQRNFEEIYSRKLQMAQLTLFGGLQENGLSFDEVATQLGVSIASVRNWIKTGYLDQISRSVISIDSFNDFRDKVAGGEKLTARANKSLKDFHNHDELLRKYRSLINETEVCGYDLGVRYEKELSNSYRNKEGVYYTPPNIVREFFRYLPSDCSGLSFCDPCCGSGNFIIAAIDHGVLPENIYGYDIDPFAVDVSKKRVFEATGYKTNKIQLVDFLEASLGSSEKCFDIIFTNPPWGKKISKQQKELYAVAVGAGKSVDTSSLFFFSCLTRLSRHGYLGFLLQDAFFNIASYEQARKKALNLDIVSIIDFGKPFKGLLTKAKGIVVRNIGGNKESMVECSSVGNNHSRLQSSFSLNPRSILNDNGSQKESEAISHLYSLPHITLNGRAKWGLGIVTGNNKKFVIGNFMEGYVAAYKGSDIAKDGVCESSSYIPNDLSLYQQVAPVDLYQASEKLIYKFISSRLVFFCDKEQRYILNSANMLIPYQDFPISKSQLAQLFNSRVVNWLFRTVFCTHKVLRSDLEALPIHCGYFEANQAFEENLFVKYLGLEELSDGTFRVKK
jgi:predicted RNA methylase